MTTHSDLAFAVNLVVLHVGGLLKMPLKGKSHGCRNLTDELGDNGLVTDTSFYIGVNAGSWTAAFRE